MSANVKLVPFADGHIPTVSENGEVHIIMPTVCATMGLEWEPQRKRIERHPILAETTSIMEVVTTTGPKPTTVMTLEGFHAFLVTLHPDRIDDPTLRELVITYQRHAFRAVFEYFHGRMRTVAQKSLSPVAYVRIGNLLKRERNPALRARLWAKLDEITDSWGMAPTERAIGYADPDYSDLLTEFWSAVRSLEECGIVLNHSRKNDLIALNLPELRAHFTDTGTEILIDTTLMKALKTCTEPRFIDHKYVNSRDGKSRYCWVFSVVPAEPAV